KDADDLELVALGQHPLADRVLPPEEALGRVFADHGHLQTVQVLRVSEWPPAGHDRVGVDGEEIPGDTAKIGSRDFLSLVAHSRDVVWEERNRDVDARRARVTYQLKIVVLQGSPHALLTRKAPEAIPCGEMRKKGGVGPVALQQLLDVAIEPHQDRDHRDERGHRDADTDQSKSGTQLVVAQRVQGHQDTLLHGTAREPISKRHVKPRIAMRRPDRAWQPSMPATARKRCRRWWKSRRPQ